MLKPLHPFIKTPGGGIDPVALGEQRGRLPEDMRLTAATYLRSCPVFLAWMEYTRDVLEGRFAVAGGSGVKCDGVYYWRSDAADYVEAYGIGFDPDFLRHVQAKQWRPPVFDKPTYLTIFTELQQRLVGD